MKKVKIYLNTKLDLDESYRKLIDVLIESSELEESVIIDRKDYWVEYEVFKDRVYVIECELSDMEIQAISNNFFKFKII